MSLRASYSGQPSTAQYEFISIIFGVQPWTAVPGKPESGVSGVRLGAPIMTSVLAIFCVGSNNNTRRQQNISWYLSLYSTDEALRVVTRL